MEAYELFCAFRLFLDLVIIMLTGILCPNKADDNDADEDDGANDDDDAI